MTARLVTVKSSGGDYTSLSGAFAGEIGDLTAAGLDRQLEIDCYNFIDTTPAISGAWTTDASHTVLIAAVDNHNGFLGGSGGTSAYSLGSFVSLSSSIVSATIRGISVNGGGLTVSGASSIVDRCIVSRASAGNSCFNISGSNTSIISCLAISNGVASTTGFALSASAVLYDCAAYNCASQSFFSVSGTTTAVNCLAVGTTATGFSSGTWTGSATCCSVDATSPSSGSGHRVSQTVTLVNPGAGDYHLALSDTGARGFGTNLLTDPTFHVLVDIDSQSIGVSTWNIGADQPPQTAALGGTATATITENDIVTGTKTITLTLANDTWTPA